MSDTPLQPIPIDQERRDLEDAYRQAIGTVRALARALGKPCPIVDREERRQQARQTLAAHAIVETNKH